MSVPAATFLAGAKGRLLPASLVFRFFVAAVIFHVLLWIMLVRASAAVPGFLGGPGPVLAAVHGLTLGVLVMTAMGAALQLLSVATKKPIAADRLVGLVSWLYIPGAAVLISGMDHGNIPLMMGGGVAAGLGLLIFAGIVADNLRGATGMGVVIAHCWAALASLAVLIGLGLALVADFHHGFLGDHYGVAVAHFLVAAFGFMGFLALGFSYVLVPMFSLAPQPSVRLGYAGLALGAAGLILASCGAVFDGYEGLAVAGALVGLAGAGIYLYLMARALKARMRKHLGLSFVLVRVAWVMLPVGIGLLAVASMDAIAGARTLAGFVVLFGWLLTFLIGIFQRILPFLALMHAGGQGSKLPSASELAASPFLKVHAVGHLIALALIAGGIVLDDARLVRGGAVFGLAGALAFACYALYVVQLMISSRGAGAAQG